MRVSVALALLAGMAAALPTPLVFTPGVTQYGDNMAPLHIDESVETIADSFLVVLHDWTPQQLFSQHRELITGAQASVSAVDAEHGLRHIYDGHGLKGYAGKFSPDVLAYIRAQPEVAFVEADSVVHAAVEPEVQVYDMPSADVAADAFPWPDWRHLTEKGAPWGLARISHRESLTLGTFNQYVYDRESGEGVVAYIIDTGINVDHEDFGGRASWGTTIPQGDQDVDGHGHGTHCAGTIGSATYGVAKHAELVAVKVLRSNGSGSMSDVTAGVLWAVADARNRTETLRNSPSTARRHRGFVANMSLGGSKSPTLELAVNGAVASGLNLAVAAGNEDQDACNVSPANARRPVTVGASTIRDERAYFSNWGPCVDIFGPGLNILSTWNTGPRSIAALSGTSMATPHVVGLLAYLLSIYGTEEFPIPSAEPASKPPPAFAPDSLWSTLRNIAEMFAPFDMTTIFNRLDRMSAAAASSSSAAAAVAASKDTPISNVISPDELKRALIALSTRGALEGLDKETRNRLAFNNATHV
ncbi:cerevisin [Malassezia cuniculi]|uniref:Cerevisin n=1 Tax=Malassezia cuniculi TaxID=948313 RepID=A0AAF0EUM5_9BASI|nr:cerevisin [Malassezia cuniculi]